MLIFIYAILIVAHSNIHFLLNFPHHHYQRASENTLNALICVYSFCVLHSFMATKKAFKPDPTLVCMSHIVWTLQLMIILFPSTETLNHHIDLFHNTDLGQENMWTIGCLVQTSPPPPTKKKKKKKDALCKRQADLRVTSVTPHPPWIINAAWMPSQSPFQTQRDAAAEKRRPVTAAIIMAPGGAKKASSAHTEMRKQRCLNWVCNAEWMFSFTCCMIQVLELRVRILCVKVKVVLHASNDQLVKLLCISVFASSCAL